MDSEVLLVKPDGQPIKFLSYNPITKETTPISLESIRDENSPCTFVFQDPSTLQHVLIHEDVLIKETTKLRVCIIYPISGVHLTSDEKNGGLGPNIAKLMAEWKDAFKAMPTNHQIKHIVFDMLCGQKLVIKHVVEVLREEKSVLKEKAGGSLLCTVQGYNYDDAMWV